MAGATFLTIVQCVDATLFSIQQILQISPIFCTKGTPAFTASTNGSVYNPSAFSDVYITGLANENNQCINLLEAPFIY